MSKKVILSMFMSLDGFIAGPNGELDWMVPDNEMEKDTYDLLDNVDTILVGGATYQIFTNFWPSATAKDSIIAEKMNTIPKIVFSKKLEKVEWGKWDNASLVKENIGEEISKMKKSDQGRDKDMVLFGGAGIAQSLMQLGLIDEYRIIVNPVVLGKGKALFKGIKDKLDLKLLKTKTFNSGSVLLYYGQA